MPDPAAAPGPSPSSPPESPADFLVRLGEQHATGALLCDAGTLYLRDGAVVHADSPDAPGLDVLLTHAGRLDRAAWQAAVDLAGPRREVARHLVDTGVLPYPALEICHLGVLFDAAFFALAPESLPGPVPTRFRPGAAHWLGTVRPVPARTVVRESRRRRALLDRVCPNPCLDTAPVCRRRGTSRPAARVTRRQHALLDLADGVRTPAAIARLLGRPAFHVLVDVRRLAAAGHLDTCPPAAAAAAAGTPSIPAWFAPAATVDVPPDIALLRRLRDALEARL